MQVKDKNKMAKITIKSAKTALTSSYDLPNNQDELWKFIDFSKLNTKIFFAPDSSVPDWSVPDDSVPDWSVPDDSVPDWSVPDDSVPDSSVPDSSVPDWSVPDWSVPNKFISDNIKNLNATNANIKTLNEEDNIFKTINKTYSCDQSTKYIHITKTSKVPLQISDIIKDQKIIKNNKLKIILEKNCQATILHNKNMYASDSLLNEVVEIHLKEGSKLNYYKIEDISQNFLTSNCSIYQEKSSTLNMLLLNCSSTFSMHNIDVQLNGDLAKTSIYGGYILEKKENTNYIVNIKHNSTNCSSRQLFKGILTDNAHGSFKGNIYVAKGATGSDGYQMNRTIMLDNNSSFDAKPSLEILNDDVQCSHGCTISGIDNAAMAYLNMRGISKARATYMLLNSFISEIIDVIDVSHVTKENILKILERKILKF